MAHVLTVQWPTPSLSLHSDKSINVTVRHPISQLCYPHLPRWALAVHHGQRSCSSPKPHNCFHPTRTLQVPSSGSHQFSSTAASQPQHSATVRSIPGRLSAAQTLLHRDASRRRSSIKCGNKVDCRRAICRVAGEVTRCSLNSGRRKWAGFPVPVGCSTRLVGAMLVSYFHGSTWPRSPRRYCGGV